MSVSGESSDEADMLIESLDSKLEELVKTAEQDMLGRAAPPPPILYHYTDVGGLLAILDSKCLRATHTRYMNDAGEASLVKDVIAEIAKELLGKLENAWAREMLTYLLNPDWTGPIAIYESFATCFSTEWDVLSQWCMYANDGLGYAIGFSSAEQFLTKQCEDNPCLYAVEYSPAAQREMVRPYIMEAVNLLSNASAQRNDVQTRGRAIFAVGVALHRALLPFGAIMKHEGFQREQEWRMLLTTVGRYRLPKVKYRSTRFGVTPYLEFACQGGTLPIKALALGPRLGSQDARSALCDLLGQHGYSRTGEVKVLNSETPYR